MEELVTKNSRISHILDRSKVSVSELKAIVSKADSLAFDSDGRIRYKEL